MSPRTGTLLCMLSRTRRARGGHAVVEFGTLDGLTAIR
jgi:predicted O-methyltransferase YrrM